MSLWYIHFLANCLRKKKKKIEVLIFSTVCLYKYILSENMPYAYRYEQFAQLS